MKEITESFQDPELEVSEESEIAAAVDVSVLGTDQVPRPVYLNQDDQIIALTTEDAKRLHGFLGKAIQFLDDYEKRRLQ